MDASKFTKKSLEALQLGQQIALRYSNMQIEQPHLLSALLSQDGGLTPELLKKMEVNTTSLKKACDELVSRMDDYIAEFEAHGTDNILINNMD